MAKSIPALVTPEVLRWARESIGLDLDTVAHKLKVDRGKLVAAEKGEGHLTMAQMGKLATLYKRALAVFYLPVPPEESEVVRDFRRLPGVPTAPSPELTVETRKAGARREIVLELLEELGDELPEFTLRARRSESPAAVAARVRAALAVDIEIQRAWKRDTLALQAWREAIEAHGVLVFQIAGVAVAETRGFSLFYEQVPIIAINSKDATIARCFSLMHEFGHLLLRRGAACDLSDRGDVETWCNLFAAEMLVPAGDLDIALAEFSHDAEWSDRAIRTLSRRFWVSPEVLVLRLVALKRATRKFYERWKAGQVHASSRGGRADPPAQTISRAGRTYVSLVLSAYHADKISESTVSSYLGARLKHLPKIEELIVGGGGG